MSIGGHHSESRSGQLRPTRSLMLALVVAAAVAGCGGGRSDCVTKTNGGELCGKAAITWCSDKSQVTDQKSATGCLRLFERER